MEITKEEIENIKNELIRYVELSNDEWGECCSSLLNLLNYEYMLSDKFQKLLYKEIKDQLNEIKKQCKIVKVKRTKVIEYEELEDING